LLRGLWDFFPTAASTAKQMHAAHGKSNKMERKLGNKVGKIVLYRMMPFKVLSSFSWRRGVNFKVFQRM
jgi:hypothetical protein